MAVTYKLYCAMHRLACCIIVYASIRMYKKCVPDRIASHCTYRFFQALIFETMIAQLCQWSHRYSWSHCRMKSAKVLITCQLGYSTHTYTRRHMGTYTHAHTHTHIYRYIHWHTHICTYTLTYPSAASWCDQIKQETVNKNREQWLTFKRASESCTHCVQITNEHTSTSGYCAN